MNKKDLISYKGNLLGVTIIEQEYFKDNENILKVRIK